MYAQCASAQPRGHLRKGVCKQVNDGTYPNRLVGATFPNRSYDKLTHPTKGCIRLRKAKLCTRREHRRPVLVNSQVQDAVEDRKEKLLELKQQNFSLRLELKTALDRQIDLQGVADEASVELLNFKNRSLEDLAAEIKWVQPDKLGKIPPFWEGSPRRSDAYVVPPLPPVAQDPSTMHIIHITAELAPVAKVGGLGDVVAGLAHACKRRGHSVQVMLPFYSFLDDNAAVVGLEEVTEIRSFLKGEMLRCVVYRAHIADIEVLLVQPDADLFTGGAVYSGCELEAYLFFSRACLEYMLQSGNHPDILHCHDWHTSVVPMLYWDIYHPLGLTRPRPVLTIHNLDFTGECRSDEFEWIGLNPEQYLTDEKALDPRTKGHNPERLSLLKGGMVYASAVTTVSPTYAEEIASGAAAEWLQPTLEVHKGKIKGLLNGIDGAVWDPARDPSIPAPFSSQNLMPKTLCKQYLMRAMGLDGGNGDERVPLVGCVTRLAPQKGIHLIKHAIVSAVVQGAAFVLLGTSQDPAITAEFEALRDELERDARARLMIMYSESLAHEIYAACDMVLVPSMFEPCGLTQMVGMKYGAVPVVRCTGGLADTVFDVDSDEEKGNGFVFHGASEADLDGALSRAITLYKEEPSKWKDLTTSVMSIDHSWDERAGGYVQLYGMV